LVVLEPRRPVHPENVATTRNREPIRAPCSLRFRWLLGRRACCRRVGQVLDRSAGGGWLEFAGGPAAALAASHLRSPATFTVQLDHLLSSVAQVNHNRHENWRAHFRILAEIVGNSSLPPRRERRTMAACQLAESSSSPTP